MKEKVFEGHSAYMQRTRDLFGNVSDLIWLKRSVAHRDDHHFCINEIYSAVDDILSVEIDDGRDVPWFRETVYAKTNWYLRHSEFHVPWLTDFFIFRILEGERVPLAREVAEWPLPSFSGKHRTINEYKVGFALIIRFILAFIPLILAWQGYWIKAICLLPLTFIVIYTRLLGPLPSILKNLSQICDEVGKEGYDPIHTTERLKVLAKRGLVINSMAFALLRLPRISGEEKFRNQLEIAGRPETLECEVPTK